MSIREQLKRVALLRVIVAVVRTMRDQLGLNLRWMSRAGCWWRFHREFSHYRNMASKADTTVPKAGDIIPCLLDRTVYTPIEPVYFVQDTWFAGRIAKRIPAHHVDVGSSAKTMALVAQFIPVTMVDIRPVPIAVEGFSFVRGSILELPFADGTVSSLSSLCVVEHIGLGRYGDLLDPLGTEKAVKELTRVLAPGGNFFLSVPVDAANRIYFNAHRAFTRDYLLGMCAGLKLVDEQFLYGFDVVRAFAPERGFGTGMFHFYKP